MKYLFKPTLTAVLGITIFMLTAFTPANSKHQNKIAGKTKIQVAVLLDVSGSMQGLIEQTKAQLWNMVSLLGKALALVRGTRNNKIKRLTNFIFAKFIK